MTAKPVFTLWLAAVIGAALFLPVYGNAQEGPGTFNSTDDLIQKLASQAVNNAERENHIDLNYSVESIKTIDKILWRAHEAYVKNPKSVSVIDLRSVYGADVGEVIRQTQSNARWQRDGEPKKRSFHYPLVWGQTMHRLSDAVVVSGAHLEWQQRQLDGILGGKRARPLIAFYKD